MNDEIIIQWIQKELNEHNYFDIIQDDECENNLLLIWKEDLRIFATIYKNAVLSIIKKDK